MSAGNSIPYIGSKISLVTTTDVRYEGILYTLNREESTIAVQNVRSFGTEGRRCPEVPMSNEIYDFIIFRGKDLKDLTVLQGTPERPSGAATYAACPDYFDNSSSALYNHSVPPVSQASLRQNVAASVPPMAAYQRQSAASTAPVRNGYVSPMPYSAPASAASAPLSAAAASFAGAQTSSGSRQAEKASSFGAINSMRPSYPSVDTHSAFADLGRGPSAVAAGLGNSYARETPNDWEGDITGVTSSRATSEEAKATATVRSSSESKERHMPGESKAKLEVGGGRGRGKGGATRKSLYEVLRVHPRAQELITKTMRTQNSSALHPAELRAMSEGNQSLFHFYIDFANYCCPSHMVQSDEQQWESLCKALKKHFEKEFGANQNQKTPQPQRPNNTLGDFITIETNSKAAKKGAKILPRGSGRSGRGGGGRGDDGDKKDADSNSGEFEAPALEERTRTQDQKPQCAKVVLKVREDSSAHSASWVCPRCTLRNENLLLECAACGTSKQQAGFLAEFPPLG